MAKRLLSVVVVALVATLAVAGCTNQQPLGQSEGTTSSATTSRSVDVIIAVKPVALSQQEQDAIQKPGEKFVAFNCTVNNTGAVSRQAPYNVWTLQDMKGGVYDPSLALNDTIPEWSNITRGNWWQGYSVGPGDTISGVVVFLVPQDVQQFKSLTYDDGVVWVVTPL